MTITYLFIITGSLVLAWLLRSGWREHQRATREIASCNQQTRAELENLAGLRFREAYKNWVFLRFHNKGKHPKLMKPSAP